MRVFKKHNVERRTESDVKAEQLLNAGFVELTGANVKADEREPKNLSKLKVDELKALAEEFGIEGIDSLNKPELLAVLKDAM